jgi:hypothetical protein
LSGCRRGTYVHYLSIHFFIKDTCIAHNPCVSSKRFTFTQHYINSSAQQQCLFLVRSSNDIYTKLPTTCPNFCF